MTVLRHVYQCMYKIPGNINAHLVSTCTARLSNELKRSVWGFVAIAFNRVDMDRLMKVGPNRLCAEWLLKNGGAIRTKGNPDILLKNYNLLPPESDKFLIKVADATGSSIMKIGLQHFNGCKHIDTVIIHSCRHLEEDGLNDIVYLTQSLKVLQVSDCGNINDQGLMVIGKLKNLELLKIYHMPAVKNMENVKNQLQEMLPNCIMDIKK
ncbi:ATP synthase subunit s, mitochondrial [Glossina fuscipes fuscipes]